MIEFKKPKRSIRIALISFCAVLLLAGLLAIFYFANQFHIDIQLHGASAITLEYGDTYTEEGATALYRGKLFMKDGKAVEIKTEGKVDAEKLGSYTLTYSAAQYGKEAKATRTIQIVDTKKPTLTLKGEEKISLTKGDTYKEPGYTAADNYDGDLTEKVTVSGELDPKTAGTYTLIYEVADSSGNTAEKKTRTITVKEEVKPPSQGSQPSTVLPGEKTIYLTFDDGPGPYTAKLLDILKKHDAKATFFVCDHSNYNYLLSRMAQEGHAIGVHTASHNYQKIYASEDAFFSDFNTVHSLILSKTGISTTLCRFPGGSSNTVSKFNKGIMTRLAQELTDRGYQYFDWNVDSFDAGGATTSAQVVSNIKRGVANNRVSIVLQHDIKSFSVNAVEEILIWGKENGYTFKALTSSSPTAHHGINN